MGFLFVLYINKQPTGKTKATKHTHTHTFNGLFFRDYPGGPVPERYTKLSYRRGTVRCVVSIEILPIATQQCRNYLYDKS